MFSSDDFREFFREYKSEAVVKEHRFYSVLIPLVEREAKMHVLLEKRAAHISQPGGLMPGSRRRRRRCASAMKKSASPLAKSRFLRRATRYMVRPISPFILS